MVRNKAKNFPIRKNKLDGMPHAQAKFSSLRANGTINSKLQKRMRASTLKMEEEE